MPKGASNLNRLFIFLSFLLYSFAATAQTISGTVMNGTTHTPAAGDQVTLLKLAGGMDEEASTKANAQGKFSFKVSETNTPRLLKVEHQNVSYMQQVRPNGAQRDLSNLQVTVFNVVPKANLSLVDDSQVFQADQNSLHVIRIFRVRNTATPPVTQGQFEFTLPEGANIDRAQAVGSSGMPTIANTVKLSQANRYAFDFPVRPGMTQYELVYTLPYSGSYKAKIPIEVQAEKFYVITPRGMNFSGSEFQEDRWPLEPNMNVATHSLQQVAQNKQVSFEISGTGVLPQDEPPQQQQGAAAGGGAEDSRPGGGLGVPNERPDPLHNGQWMFLGVMTLFLAAGGVYVYTANQPEPVLAGAAARKAAKNKGNTLLDAMKEELFQLETERLQGRIGQEEYESSKAALDKTLQRAVQRQKGK